jgi:hypothetical protein
MPLPYQGPTKTGWTVIANGASWLTGYAFEEVTGKARARIALYDGTSELVPISLNPGESTREFAGRRLPVSTGVLKVEVLEGEVEGLVLGE